MSQKILNSVSASLLKSGRDNFKVGDGVKVYTKVREGDKERVQIFAGIVIARKGGGIAETFTVRRISYGEGVERVFPVNSPLIEKVAVDRKSVPMKARLYYLRGRLGKQATKVKERRFLEAATVAVPTPAPAPVAAAATAAPAAA
ncbi:MAG: 50S ribosomal protein L19 [Puniceicoccales bacterium]|jgi:large subunit ribosomal protein L19|nr:50S ribosomal protein L19 [Puniceicoccales bacterium]